MHRFKCVWVSVCVGVWVCVRERDRKKEIIVISVFIEGERERELGVPIMNEVDRRGNLRSQNLNDF